MAQEAAAAATLRAEQAAAEAAIYANPLAGGSNPPPAGGVVGGVHIQPLVSAILQGVGRQAPATLPVVVHSLPVLARTGAIGADGIAIADPMTAQIAILNEEKRKAKAYQVDAKDNKAKLYDRERD